MEDLGLVEILSGYTALPNKVVLDLSRPVRRIFSVFEPCPMNIIGPEYIVDQAIEACTCRTSAHRDIAKFAHRLMQDMQVNEEHRRIAMQEFGRPPELVRNNEWPYPPIPMLDQAITVEQATLDIFDEFISLKLYLNNQYLPYRYEHMIAHNAVMLMKYQSAEEFFDRIAYLNA